MRLLLALLLLSFATLADAQPLPSLQGDPEAVARIERMFARMGGRGPWARAQSMYIHYRQLSSGARPGEGEERAWRDIARPGERLEWRRTGYDGRESAWARSFDAQGGWRRTDAGIRLFTAEEHRQAVDFWQRDFYTAFRRMAAGDPAWRYRFTAPHRIDVIDAAGAVVGWWEIDQGGTLLRWGTTDDDGTSQLSYIYGPFRTYGSIAFPAWGTSSDGIYRFEYLDFAISPDPLPEEAFRDPATPPRGDLRLR
jgi:hypothetical protein